MSSLRIGRKLRTITTNYLGNFLLRIENPFKSTYCHVESKIYSNWSVCIKRSSQSYTSAAVTSLKHFHVSVSQAYGDKPNINDHFESVGATRQEDAADEDWEQSEPRELYPGHIPTTNFQKGLLSVAAALVTITSPHRGDMLAAFGEASGHTALRWMKSVMDADPVGRQILLERPRINSRTVDLRGLSELGDETFGRTYSNWLRDNHASPDDRLAVQFVDDAELWYVMQRYREIHDLLHCLLGMPTNMLGEVTIKVFEGIQTRLPMCVTGGIFGPLRLGPKHTRIYFRTHLAWAVRNAINASNVMNVYFEHHWNEPISELRRRLNIEEPPYTPAKSFGTKQSKSTAYTG